jgi:hypothetical protein
MSTKSKTLTRKLDWKVTMATALSLYKCYTVTTSLNDPARKACRKMCVYLNNKDTRAGVQDFRIHIREGKVLQFPIQKVQGLNIGPDTRYRN